MSATFIYYIREDRVNRQGLCPIYLKITYERKRRYLNTGIRISPSEWNDDKQKVRRNHRTYQQLNQELEILTEKAQQYYRELNRDGKASAEAIKRRLMSSSKDNFFTLAYEYIDELEANEQFWTKKQTKVAVEKMRTFHGSDDLPLNLIDVAFMEQFQNYLKTKLGNLPSTIHKNLGAVRIILDRAVKHHLLPANPLKNEGFSIVKKNSTSVKAKLNAEQIQALDELELERGSNHWHARNAFILSFYLCGMRFGDLASLRWKDVKGGRLVYNMNKTGNPINVKIPEGAKRILNHYRSPDTSPKDVILPFLSDLPPEEIESAATVRKKISSANAWVNSCLKDIAKEAGIDETISMHVARHSFAQYGMEKGITVYKMMMLLGHQSIKVTQDYLKTIDVKLVDETIDAMF